MKADILGGREAFRTQSPGIPGLTHSLPPAHVPRGGGSGPSLVPGHHGGTKADHIVDQCPVALDQGTVGQSFDVSKAASLPHMI